MSRNSTCNNPKTIAYLRDMIREQAGAATLDYAQYGYGFVRGWFDALCQVGEITRAMRDTLRDEAKAAFEQAVADLNAASTVTRNT